MTNILLVKIGGSLLRTGQWRVVMDSLLARSHARHEALIIIVGGGALADDVRRQCAARGASAAEGHALCIKAMADNALHMAQHYPRLQTCEDTHAAWHAIHTHTPTIWVGVASIICDSSVQPSDSITSDSLAVWLAAALLQHAHSKLAANDIQLQVLLIKSCVVPHHMAQDAQALAQAGVVDEAFPAYVQRLRPYANATWRVVNAAEAASIA